MIANPFFRVPYLIIMPLQPLHHCLKCHVLQTFSTLVLMSFITFLRVKATTTCSGKDERVSEGEEREKTSTKNSDSGNGKILNKFIDITLSILTAPCGINRSRLHFLLAFWQVVGGFFRLFLVLAIASNPKAIK